MTEALEFALTSPVSSTLILLGLILVPTVIFEEYFGIKPRKEVRWTAGALGLSMIIVGLGMRMLLTKQEEGPSQIMPSVTHQEPLRVKPSEGEKQSSEESSQGAVIPEPTVSPLKEPAQPKAILQAAKPVAESDNYRFNLIGCYLAGNSVTCKLTVTNLTADRYLSCQTDYMTIWDDQGFEYKGDGVRMGEFSGYGSSAVSKQLISGIPIHLELDFKGWRPEGKFISVLKMDCQETEVEFRGTSNSA